MDRQKKEIIKTSSVMFFKNGIRSVSVDEICDELRISKKTFYNYFRQKEELLVAILKNFSSEHDKNEECLMQMTFSNVIDKILWLKQLKTSAEVEKKHQRFFNDLVKYYPVIYANFSVERSRKTEQMFEEQITQGIEQGLFRDDINKMYVIKSLTHLLQYFVDLTIQQPRKFSKKLVVEFMVDSYLRMVCNNVGLQYYTSCLQQSTLKTKL